MRTTSPVTTSRTVVTTALAQAASALKDVSHDLKMDALTLQAQMQRENLVFTSVSNVLKTRHDTAKNSINNVR